MHTEFLAGEAGWGKQTMETLVMCVTDVIRYFLKPINEKMVKCRTGKIKGRNMRSPFV